MPQTVIMTVGCPGSGKTTFANEYRPDWVVLSLDDFRTSLFRNKKYYHEASAKNIAMRKLLNNAYESSLFSALEHGFSAILSNMHVYPNSFKSTMKLLSEFGIVPELRVFVVPFHELVRRNESRPDMDRVPYEFLSKSFADFQDKHAWWRFHRGRVEIEEFKQ